LSFPCECALFNESNPLSTLKKRRTLQRAISTSGIGLFSGKHVEMRLLPAEGDEGIIFRRMDLPSQPKIPARIEFVKETPRTTILGKDGATVQTVEHLMATLFAFSIDQVVVEIHGPEVPIFDGSAVQFVSLIEEAGIQELDTWKKVCKIDVPLFWSSGDIFLIALPSDAMQFSYTLHCPHVPLIGTQFTSFLLEHESFVCEIAPSRTFSIYEEISPLIEKGELKGGSIHNAIVVKEGRLLNPDGLRFSNEMARHKILDLIGDIALIPIPFIAHIIAIRSGHASNYAFAKELYARICASVANTEETGESAIAMHGDTQ
jgi:UDP-3-O-[3-hydroxymyristoyl] N-acetylglucosamine deacetylase